MQRPCGLSDGKPSQLFSAPSWSLLDTGQRLQVKGNVEFDRYTLHSYDYLNVIPFWLNNAIGARVDMPAVEVLDELGVPLLMDSYAYEERYTGLQLYQRGARWTTLQRGLQNRFTSRSPSELFDEWQLGIGGRSIIDEQQERELIEKLSDPSVRYLDFYTTAFDHASHNNRDEATHLAVLKELDALVGRVWAAIQKTPQAAAFMEYLTTAEAQAFWVKAANGISPNRKVPLTEPDAANIARPDKAELIAQVNSTDPEAQRAIKSPAKGKKSKSSRKRRPTTTPTSGGP